MPDAPLDVEVLLRRERLRDLSVRYAAAVDRRDRGGLLGVFTTDASLIVHGDGEDAPPTGRLRGHAEIGQVVERIGRFARTSHLLGQSSYHLGDDTATGEVRCLASHLDDRAGTPATVVMHVRYLDRYRSEHAGEWRIAERRVLVDWQETHRHAEVGP